MRKNKNVTNFIFFIIFTLFIFISKTAETQELSLWKDLGLYGGQITSLAIDPTDAKVMYAGSWGGDGLFKSTDNGTTWFSIPQDMPAWFRNQEIHDIEIDPNDPDTIWVANNHYVDVSHNAGANWQTFYFADEIVDPCFDDYGCDTTKSGRICYSVAVDPFDSNRVYVGTGGPSDADEKGEIFITEDGGNNWANQGFWSDELVWNNFWQIKFNPNKQGEIWVANRKSYISPEGYVYMSTDYAQSWSYWSAAVLLDDTVKAFGYIDEVLVHPVNPLRIFLCSGEGIAVKTSGSAEEPPWYWTSVDTDSRAMCIPPQEPDTIYAALSSTMAKSTDNGVTWDATSLRVPGEFLALEPHPENASVLFAGSLNQGVYKTTDRAQNWDTFNHGIKANTIYDTALHPANPGAILCGTLAGIFLKTADALLKINASSSFTVAFHPSNPNIIYAGFAWCIGKSTDKGATWTYLNTPSQEANRIVSLAIAQTGADSATIYAAVSFDSGKKGQILKIYDNGGAIDTAPYLTIFESSVPVNAVALQPQNPSVIVAGTGSFNTPTAPGGISISKDGGQTWRSNFFTRTYTANCIAFDPLSPNIIYAGCGASDGKRQGLLKSINGGLTWRKAQGGLPKIFAVKDIKVADDGAGTVYAALYRGASNSESSLSGTYVSLNRGKYWTRTGLSDYMMYDVNIENPGAALSRQATASAATASVPTYTVYAGTGSGLLTEDQSTIAGTGVVSGMITSTLTKTPIGEAYVRSTAGTGAQSNNGFYLMLVPSGQHTIQVTAPGYFQVGSSTVYVNAGGATEFNLTMTPSGSGTPNCISEQLLQAQPDSSDLRPLRAFRDNILIKTAYGRSIISLYYGMGGEILPVLESNARLKALCISLIRTAAASARAAVAGKPLSLPAGFMDKASAFLMELEQASPADLRQKIKKLRCDMRTFKHDRLQESRSPLQTHIH